MKVSRQILAVSRRNRTACYGLRKGCECISPSAVTLTVWRAGRWPKLETTCVLDPLVITSGCATCPAPSYHYVTTEVWPTRVQYTGIDSDAQGRICFVLDDLLFAQGAGRYDADLVACGKTIRVHLSVQDEVEITSMVNLPVTGCRLDCEVTPAQ